MGEIVLAISCSREEHFIWMNVWGLNPELLCLQLLMVEATVEKVSFVECPYEWSEGGGGKRAPLKMAKNKGDLMISCFLNSPRSIQDRVAPLRACVT